MSGSFDLPAVDRITVGTVGPAGKRTFYLQARQQDRLITLKLEKQQVGALARFLTGMLADLPAVGALPDNLDLEEPALEEWPVGTLQITYDAEADQVILVAEEAVFVAEDDEPVEGVGAMARFGATREQVAAVAIRGRALVEAGRPPCPLCGNPLDPAGHVCPRTNGHRPPTP